jgi:hypothetical protein
VLVEGAALGGRCKWLKDLVDGGSKERFNEGTICVEECLKLIEVDLVDALSAKEGEN